MLQDANYNVVAILTDTGNVVTQYTYEPYGLLVAVEHIPAGVIPPVNRVGHQGLFYERFDGQYTDLT